MLDGLQRQVSNIAHIAETRSPRGYWNCSNASGLYRVMPSDNEAISPAKNHGHSHLPPSFSQRQRESLAMDYCGVAYIAFESVEDSSWKWRILTSCGGNVKIGGEAASREAAIERAHEAIGETLRANARPDYEANMPLLADDALHILHGARSLPLGKAIEALQPFLNEMRHRIPGADRFADASTNAVTALVQSLEARGSATDDAWQAAIESTLSFANEAS
jgi:hypothetical protein